MLTRNFLLTSDAYKYTHHGQYPPGMEYLANYLEARIPDGSVRWFGLQMLLEPLIGKLFDKADITEASEFCKAIFMGHDYFNRDGWEHILQRWGGRLPLRIKAAPEGLVIPGSNVLMTIENTDPAAFWLPNWIETRMLRVWYPTTVCTRSHRIRLAIDEFASRTGCRTLPYHLNDFGYRGVSSEESAGIGGCAHLVNFCGTDNLAGIVNAIYHYGAKPGVGVSVMAAEHSTITAWGDEREEDAYRHILSVAPPDALVSIVSDSYDIFHAVRHLYGNHLKSQVMDRPGVLVVRPDSGHPPTMTREVLEALWDAFGGTQNQHGYRTLDPHVRVIYGDGIEEDSIRAILQEITRAGAKFTTDNVVFGMGGQLLQGVNRDTYRFALKASAVKMGPQREERDTMSAAAIGTSWRPVRKTTKTDSSKASKGGRLKLVRGEDGVLRTFSESTSVVAGSGIGDDVLETVYENGEVTKIWLWDEVVG